MWGNKIYVFVFWGVGAVFGDVRWKGVLIFECSRPSLLGVSGLFDDWLERTGPFGPLFDMTASLCLWVISIDLMCRSIEQAS